MLQKYDAIISKSSIDIGQTDLIEMHIATRLETAPVAAPLYPLALRHHDFLKQEIKSLLDVGIIHKCMFSWASPIVVVKKHTPEGLPQQFCLCIDYRKLNSLPSAVTPAMGTKKGVFALIPLLKINELLALLKGAKYLQHLTSMLVTTTSSGLYQGTDILICLIYDLCNLDNTSNQGKVLGYLAYLDNILIYGKTEKRTLTNVRQSIEMPTQGQAQN